MASVLAWMRSLIFRAAASIRLLERAILPGEGGRFDAFLEIGLRVRMQTSTARELLLVPRRDFRGRLRVEPLQGTMQVAGRMFLNACAEPLAQFFRALRNVRKTLEQRAQIQSCADR